jgi:hypothetical protein
VEGMVVCWDVALDSLLVKCSCIAKVLELWWHLLSGRFGEKVCYVGIGSNNFCILINERQDTFDDLFFCVSIVSLHYDVSMELQCHTNKIQEGYL